MAMVIQEESMSRGQSHKIFVSPGLHSAKVIEIHYLSAFEDFIQSKATTQYLQFVHPADGDTAVCCTFLLSSLLSTRC